MSETGVVKFHGEASGGLLEPFPGLDALNQAREELRRLGLLGISAEGVGFGNVSQREGGGFVITGSGTGGLSSLGASSYARVLAWDYKRNWLRYEGVIPSAESLTHAAVYDAARDVKAVIHGHSRELWEKLRRAGASTRAEAAYGTAAMAEEVQRLFCENKVREEQMFAMEGHEEGVVFFGSDFPAAFTRLHRLHRSQ